MLATSARIKSSRGISKLDVEQILVLSAGLRGTTSDNEDVSTCSLVHVADEDAETDSATRIKHCAAFETLRTVVKKAKLSGVIA